jgi:murein DD-endopeptidase MepM/ murein hydrolase activator NlpD
MRYIFFVLLFVSSAVFGGTSIDKKIHKTSSQLHSYKRNYVNINKKLKETAQEILRQKRELKKQIIYLQKLKAELTTKESSYDENIAQLKLLRKSQDALKEKQEKIEERLVFFIAKSVSLSVVLEEKYAENEESLMQVEILKTMLKSSQDEVKKLNSVFYENEKKVKLLRSHANTLQSSITQIDSKRKKLVKITKANKLALAKLQKEKAAYTRQLKRVIKRQNALKNTLEKLNIVKRDAIEKERQRKEREKAFARQKINLNENLPKVKQHGNSYQSVKTIRYRGPKTIAPLARYTIVKKYGPYTDPIYGIKIFNESISLRPKSPNAKVKNVMNGKVIYADNTAVLDNIVIVEHKNGLHTIYANLSQIAPNIRKGKKIRRGAVIGRVRDELVFEVTQKSYHINPIRLFK